tara:strand:- start:296 stop:649 length:354 start_codon:yes stop_codon:yes gene_type:complete
MFLKKLIAAVLILGLSACSSAKTASEISAAYVPMGKYKKMSCSELRAEERYAKREVDDMRERLEKSYKDDKTAEAIGWILFAPALLVMDGNSAEQREFGEAKGLMMGIQDVMDAKGC